MATKTAKEPVKAVAKFEPTEEELVIAAYVMALGGLPPHTIKKSASKVGSNNWRCNILVSNPNRVAESHFLKVEIENNKATIISSNPPLQRKYHAV